MDKPRSFIFDIDGTLADNSHRTHWVESKPKNWRAYNSTMDKDTLIIPVYKVLRELEFDYRILICSGREEVYRDVTEKWLEDHYIRFDEFLMRPAKDYRSDTIVKSEMLDKLQETYDIMGVFDDRPSVIKMWRDRGLYVFDCNQSGRDF